MLEFRLFIGILAFILPLPVFEFIIGVFIGIGEDVDIGVDALELEVT